MVLAQEISMLIKASRHVANATKYSLAGFRFLVGSELAARMELYVFVFVAALYAWLGVPWLHFIIAGGLLFLILAVEALNTAIEVIIDRVSPEISDTGKRAKDLGSFAVMCLTLINGMHFCYVLSIMLAPELGLKILAIAVVVFFLMAALYTKLRKHKPRLQQGK